jgi:hypothetical protein
VQFLALNIMLGTVGCKVVHLGYNKPPAGAMHAIELTPMTSFGDDMFVATSLLGFDIWTQCFQGSGLVCNVENADI